MVGKGDVPCCREARLADAPGLLDLLVVVLSADAGEIANGITGLRSTGGSCLGDISAILHGHIPSAVLLGVGDRPRGTGLELEARLGGKLGLLLLELLVESLDGLSIAALVIGRNVVGSIGNLLGEAGDTR